MKASQVIKLSDLPSSVLEQLPFSIRTRKSEYIFSELPIQVQYIIEKYYEAKVPEVQYNNMIDADFEISAYSDFQVITNKKDFVKNSFQNYLQVKVGSYPWDVYFGCAIKDQLQTKDTALRQTLLSNELYLVAGVVGDDFDIDVSVTKMEVIPLRGTDHTENILNIEVKTGNNTNVFTTGGTD